MIYKNSAFNEMNPNLSWKHSGGKLRELGASRLSDAELLSILISSGIKGKSAETIANELLKKYGSLKGLADQPFDKLYKIKGLKEVKVHRIAASFEIARRIVEEVLNNYDLRKK